MVNLLVVLLGLRAPQLGPGERASDHIKRRVLRDDAPNGGA
jgi:hypothetical protein